MDPFRETTPAPENSPEAESLPGAAPAALSLRTRPATVDDAADLARLAEELGHPEGAEELAGRVAELGRDPDSALYVSVDPGAAGGDSPAHRNGRAQDRGQDAGEIVGWVHVLLVKTLLGPRRAHLGGLIVDARYRGRRVGRTLLARAEAWAADQGCKELVVRTRHTRKRAHAFYAGRGYVHSKTQHVFKREL